MPEVSERFRTAHGREWNQNDVAIMYQSFEKHLFASLQDFTTPVPGVIETMEQLLSLKGSVLVQRQGIPTL